MFDIETLGGNPDPIARYMTNERWWAFNGLAIDWRFKGNVGGIAFSYMQGLYPCDFQVFGRDVRDHVPFPGRGYTPVVSFFGVSAESGIDRLIVQSGAIGNVRLVAAHLFSNAVHEPLPSRRVDHDAELQKIVDKLLDTGTRSA